jgi:hypothetical protein
MNPILFVIGLATVFCMGPSFLVYLVIMVLVSSLAGCYCEDRINSYDNAIRERARQITGRNQPGSAELYAKFVSDTTRCLGPFIPVLPLIAIGFGMYFAHETRALESGRFFERGSECRRIPSGFASAGAFRY